MSKLASTCLTVALALAIFASCGGGDGDGGTSAPTRDTPAEGGDGQGRTGGSAFDREAEEICEEGRDRVLRKLSAYQKQNGAVNPRDIGVEAVSQTVLPVFREEVDDISKLKAPAGDEERVAALLAERRRALDEIEREGLSSNVELFDVFRRSDRLMRAYGLESCTFS